YQLVLTLAVGSIQPLEHKDDLRCNLLADTDRGGFVKKLPRSISFEFALLRRDTVDLPRQGNAQADRAVQPWPKGQCDEAAKHALFGDVRGVRARSPDRHHACCQRMNAIHRQLRTGSCESALRNLPARA